jgi:tRNA(Ile)-lysidine synthase
VCRLPPSFLDIGPLTSDLPSHVAARLAACGAAGPVVVGVSGGLDSTVLLDALVRAGVPVVGVHVHHGLRGADADADAAHAEALCAARGVPFVLRRAEHPPESNRQAWGRALRYRVFVETARAHGAAWAATAHHADDQAETVLLALLRGTGPRGLAGMAEVRRLEGGVRLVRPLLALPRAALRAYVETHALTWREDASNADPRYRRAALRRDVMPRLEALSPGAAARIARSAAFVGAERRLAAPAWRRLFASALVPTPTGGQVHAAALDGLPEAVRTGVLFEAVRRFLHRGATVDLALRLDRHLHAQVGRRLVLGGVTVYRTRKGLAFVQAAAEGQVGRVLEPGASVALPGGRLTLEIAPPPAWFARDPNVAWFDADALALPLIVRVWQAGDRIVPFGMAGHQNVSDVLTNANLEPDVRARTPVVLDAHGAVVAVVGVRAGHVAPLTDATRRVLCLRFIPDATP